MKKMKKMKIFTLLTLSVLLFAQCDDNFDELNIDPNAAISVDPSTLLTTAQYNFYKAVQGPTINADWGLLMVQQWAQTEYTEDSRYNQDITFFDNTWSDMYASVLKELEAANPDNRRIQFQLGLFSIKSGQFEKAVTRFENVISIDSTYAEAYYYKAHSYAGLGVLDTARMTFEKALLKATEEELKEEIKNYIIELKKLENAKR